MATIFGHKPVKEMTKGELGEARAALRRGLSSGQLRPEGTLEERMRVAVVNRDLDNVEVELASRD